LRAGAISENAGAGEIALMAAVVSGNNELMKPGPPEILYEDNHLIVVNKPPLLATMGVAADHESMVTRVKDYLRRKYDKPGNVYLGVVSRLDSHACGVLVFARTSKAAGRLSEMFREGSVGKTYLAIVEGNLSGKSGIWEDWMIKDEAAQRMRTVNGPRGKSESGKALHARLGWRCLGAHNDLTLVEIDLQTGRKHQIRAQFAGRGFPILGDRKYGSRRAFEGNSGIALLAHVLKLEHPVRKSMMEFPVQPPDSWKIGRFR
jgi:23S rRNA pseudouridine1911/1915/1917 synthase